MHFRPKYNDTLIEGKNLRNCQPKAGAPQSLSDRLDG